MCTTDEDMEDEISASAIVGQTMATMRQALKIGKATGMKIDLSLFPDDFDDTFTGWFRIGDYELWVNESANVFRFDYEPESDLRAWKHNVDPSRIVSFTMPPLEDMERP